MEAQVDDITPSTGTLAAQVDDITFSTGTLAVRAFMEVQVLAETPWKLRSTISPAPLAHWLSGLL